MLRLRIRFKGINMLLGLLIIVMVVGGGLVWSMASQTKGSFKSLRHVLIGQDMYVSPGPYGGIYQVNERYQDVKFFTKWLVRQLNMYTEDKLYDQYLSVQKFMSPQLLLKADRHYSQEINRTRTSVSHVVIHDGDIEVDEVPAREQLRRGEKDYFVIVYATVQRTVRERLLKPEPRQITIRLKPVSITNSNPYGFVILDYAEKQKRKIERPV